MDLEEYVKSTYQEIRSRMVRNGVQERYMRVMRIVMVADNPDLMSVYIYPVVDPKDKIHPVTLKRIES